MTAMSKSDAMSAFEGEYEVIMADTPELIRESYRLRYQVYCTERHFLEGEAGMETDEFDEYSHHILLVHRESRQAVGSARLIVGSAFRPTSSFPMQRLCDGRLPGGVPVGSTAEVSRFAISKARRSASSTALMRLALVRGLVSLSARLGITHWCAVMEPSLLRLLQTTAIVFEPFGPAVEYHGLRQPCWNDLGLLLDRVAEDRPELWDFLTVSGAFHTPAPHQLRLAA